MKSLYCSVVACVAFGFGLGAANAAVGSNRAPRWPFGITPAGEPIVRVPLTAFPQQEFAGGLSLQHELFFDGMNYRSRVVIPELRSYLVSTSGQQLRWVRLNGSSVAMDRQKEVRSGGRSWRIEAGTPPTSRIVSSDGAERYEFVRSVLTSARMDGRDYEFRYEDDRLLRVTRRNSAVEEELVAIEYDASGSIGKVTAGGYDFRFEYDADLRLIACTRRGPEEEASEIVACGYRDELLIELKTKAKQWTFAWGRPERERRFGSAATIPPIVTFDGRFGYRTWMNGSLVTTEFRSAEGPAQGRWQFDLKTGRLLMASNSGLPDE